MWHAVAPALGTNDVVVTFTASARFLLVTAISRTGVDQVNPVGAPVTAIGTSATPSVVLSSVGGNVVQDALTWDKYQLPQALATVGVGQTALTNLGGSFQLGGATSEGGPATVPMTWTLSTSRAWSMIAVEIRSVGSLPDVVSPVLQSVTASAISATSATITWTSDEPADSRVEYGLSATYGSSRPLASTLTTSHSQVLSGLTADTPYHYRVTSSDAWGNAAASADFTFATLAAPPPSATPNILLIISDNQNERSVAEAMTQVQTLLAAQGVTFTNAHVPYPLCCPARATFLTGQYSHNNNVMSNGPPTGGYANLNQSRTLPVWLQQAGYHTAHIGKFLSGYGTQDSNLNDAISACKEVPLGWNEWYGNVASDYGTTDFVLNENGALVKYGNPALFLPLSCTFSANASGFQTDVYSQKAIDIINRRAIAMDGKPFFITVAFGAPEGAITAPRHIGSFPTFPLPLPPSFNEADVSDKPAKIQATLRLGATRISTMTTFYRKHLSSLLAIDEGVRDMVDALSATGQLANTVIFYLSDQGKLFGEHRVTGIAWPYEESVQIPFIVRGPGFPAGTSINSIVSGVDLAPTILDLARGSSTLVMDGASLLPLVRNPALPWRTYSLMEANTSENTSQYYNAVRDSRYVYIEHGPSWTEAELYDLVLDPFQVASKHADPAYTSIRQNLKSQLNVLKTCSGSACWR